MLKPLEHLGVKLADGLGQNKPIITDKKICFNGLEKCGHQQRDLGITWPSSNAKGISENKTFTQLQELTKSSWFAGASLETRVCGGDCSHETFLLEQRQTNIPSYKLDTESNGLIFQCTKTAFKPYDLAVNVCLIIAKHYLKDKIKISYDGESIHWEEARQLCNHFLGYGSNFELDSE